MPFVGFPIGEMYSGLVPVSNDDTSRQLFFVFKPAIESPVDEVTIWLNVRKSAAFVERTAWLTR